jgi:type II secretory ATPase GspE/PulE/Tfp pilus assembly ATPase PilB-like protein
MTWVEDALRQAGAIPGASDLVLEPQDDGGLEARVRCEGVYRSIGRCPAADAVAAVARLKALARIPAYITREPQDGRIDGSPFGIPGDVRLAALPTVRGQRVALRLPALGPLPGPEGLGLPSAALAALRAGLRQPDGLVLVTGPTGSGKTTTIHSLLTELAAQRPDRVVVSLEDPVERRLPGVVQVEVDPAGGFGFLEGLRAALRQDADVLVVGEVRDAETARATARAALTGHLVVATLHCGRAREAFPRLVEMGVEPALALPALRLVLAQRLVRRRHRPCAGAGCPACHQGWLGRVPLADLLLADGAVHRLLAAGGEAPLAEDMDRQAAALVAAGGTDAGEVARVLAAPR